MFTRLAFLLLLVVVPGLALADEAGKTPPACVPKNWSEVEAWREWSSHTPPANAENWVEEKTRYANDPDVWRHLDRLFLAVEDGKVVTLTDCPFTDDMYVYLYETYDAVGGFHVVRTIFYEDHVYALVMRKTGKIIDIPGLPKWSPDRKRFAYGVCDVLNAKEEFAILRPEGDGLEVEFEAAIPCGLGDCELAWESPVALTATCLKAGEVGKERKRVRYTRQGDTWVAATIILR